MPVEQDLNKSVEIIDKIGLFQNLAKGKSVQLTNDSKLPIEDMIHPLIHSSDVEKHPDMLLIPMNYKLTRNFKKLFDELKKDY